MNASPPCVLYEDEHMLAVNKPAGLNTHAPAPFAGEGIYDWLRHREPRWAKLAIIHRLDKETSGVLVFGKSPEANRSLTRQFTERSVRKKYVLITDRPVKPSGEKVVSTLVRAGEKYVSRTPQVALGLAETHFRVLAASPGRTILEARPITGRTHQIRVHAADRGFPILGDSLYGGTPAARLFLHSEELAFRHPSTQAELTVHAPVDFDADTRQTLRAALIDPGDTNAHRLIHGAADGRPDWFVDRFGEFLLSQSAEPLADARQKALDEWSRCSAARGVYHKALLHDVRRASSEESSPQLIIGEAAPDAFVIRENGAQFEIRFGEGYSVGLFLDQRENRRRLLTRHIAAGFPLSASPDQPIEVLNAFAYTCGFSVCAALGGARVTSLDLSKKYLEWGRRNFSLNSLKPDDHAFIYGDVFDWVRRLTKKRRAFDVIVLDPPTYSRSKQFGAFQVEKQLSALVKACLPLLRSNGILFASTNAAGWTPEAFLAAIRTPACAAGRKVVREHFTPQPGDFPISREEPAYLKSVWMLIA